jgi:hypothetical protein
MPSPSPMSDLAHAISTLAASGASGDARIGEALAAWRTSSQISFEEALGVGGGFRSAWWLRQRDAAIMRIAGRLPATMKCRPRAAKVTSVWAQYAASAWPLDWAAGRRPDGRSGDCYDALVANGGELLSEGQIRRIIGASSS